MLKKKFTEAPIIAYQNFEHDVQLETNACIREGPRSCAFSAPGEWTDAPHCLCQSSLVSFRKKLQYHRDRNVSHGLEYQHFCAHHLYGHEVTMLTDYSVVRAVLETPSQR